MLRVKLCEEVLSVLTCLLQIDSELCVVLKRLYRRHNSSMLWATVGVLLELRVARMEVPWRHQRHLRCSHGCPLLLLIVRVPEEVSLLRRVVGQPTHHARHLVSCLHLIALVHLHRLALIVGLLGRPRLLMRQLSLHESVRVRCCCRTSHEGFVEALMRPGTSVRSHSELHRSLLLLIVLELHLPQGGVLVRLLLHIVLVEGYTCDRSIVIKQVYRLV